MPMPSNWPGTCKDCGATYAKGDMIDKNGNESLNKNGEMKPHWCPNGENCKVALVRRELPGHNPSTLENTIPRELIDLTPEQFLELGKAMMSPLLTDESKDEYVKKLLKETQYKIADELIKRSEIERAMNDLGLQHPSRLGFVKDVLR